MVIIFIKERKQFKATRLYLEKAIALLLNHELTLINGIFFCSISLATCGAYYYQTWIIKNILKRNLADELKDLENQHLMYQSKIN